MTSSDGWPTSRVNPQRTGRTTSHGPSTAPEVRWSRNISYVYDCAIHAGTVFTSHPLDTPTIYAFEAESGTTQWDYTLEHEENAYITADTASQRLLSISRDGIINQFDFQGNHHSKRSFETQLNASTGDRANLILDSTLCVAGDERVLLINLESGDVARMSMLNRGAALASDDEQLFVLSDGGLQCLNIADSAVIWRRPRDELWTKKEAMAHGPKYVGVCADTVYVSSTVSLIAINRSTGAERWRIAADGLFPPVLTEDEIYQRLDDELAAIDARTGEEQWRFTGLDAPPVAAVGANGVLYTGEYSGDSAPLYAIDAQTGEQLWTQSGLTDLYQLLVADGKLFARCGRGLFALW